MQDKEMYIEGHKSKKRSDTSCDYLLPDYMGDIKRMLCYSAKILPAGEFHDEDILTHSGVVAYSVIYLDGENKLTEAQFTSDYDVEEKIDSSYVCSEIKSILASLSIRVGGPRKLIAKASISSDIYIKSRLEFPTVDLEGAEYKRLKITPHVSDYYNGGERECAELGAQIAGVSAEEVELVWCSGNVNSVEGEKIQNTIALNAVLNVSCLLRIRGEEYMCIEREMSIENQIETENLRDNCSISAECIIGTVNAGISNATDDNGDSGVAVVFNAVCDFSARADYETECYVITDAYVSGCETELEFFDLIYSEYVDKSEKCIGLDFKSDKRTLEIENIESCVGAWATASVTSYDAVSDGINIRGEVSICFIYKGNESGGFSGGKCAYPFELKLEGSFDGAENLDVRAEALGARIAANENDICVNVNIKAYAMGQSQRKVLVLKSIEVKGECEEYKNCINVYYPTQGDSLWEIAKEYKASMAQIAEDNALSVESMADSEGNISLSGVKILYIN